MRILCLHGARQTGQIFENRLDALARKVRGFAALSFLDAPFALPLEDGHDVATRRWHEEDSVDALDDGAWAVAVATVVSFWESNGPFDGVLGFSQGAALCCLLCRMVRKLFQPPPT